MEVGGNDPHSLREPFSEMKTSAKVRDGIREYVCVCVCVYTLCMWMGSAQVELSPHMDNE